MLLSLTVRNFTLVEELHTEFQSGMTTITGETGAGKSLILDALGIALGDRGDTGRIRQGKDRLDVTAVFAVGENQLAMQWLAENDLNDGSDCILRRTLNQEGRSKGFINGQPATMQQLQQLGEMMIDIHSQHEHQSLLVKESHRRLLDDFAGCQNLSCDVQEAFGQWQQTRQRLELITANAEETQARQELLTFQLEELSELNLQANEIELLEKEQHLLANGEHILRDSHQLLALCREGDQGDALSLLNQSLQLLHTMPEKSDRLAEAESLLDSAAIQVEEACREVQQHIDSFDISPERLQEVENRLSLIYQLARKHRVNPDALMALQQQIEVELAEITGGEQGVEGLQQRLSELDSKLVTLEEKLSKQRKKAATDFAKLANNKLGELAMSSASLSVELLKEPHHTRHGREAVEFMVSTNPGQPHKPLSKVASGGELSRISLAIQVIAAQHSNIPTLVFDEVDVGVGGAVAEVVGKLLHQLGERGQVLCVTHLPQVACCAHHHFIASKKSDGKQTQSELNSLSPEERISEIARMLGGSRMTEQTVAHAREMLALAAS